MKFDAILPSIKNKALVFDIETSAFYPHNGKPVSIGSDFVGYVQFAEVKWIGLYSYKNGMGYCYNVKEDRDKIIKLFLDHDILVGFNSAEFDYPIVVNNGLCSAKKKYVHVDCMQILGKDNFKDRQGFAYKNRGSLMKYNFKNNKLKTFAEEMKLETQKGEIDYKIFQKDEWTNEELDEIKKYLEADIMATKQMFDKLWDYWLPFTDMLTEKYVQDLSWLRNSIASLTYKCVCSMLGIDATYSEVHSEKEEMGGNVIEPKYEEATDVWYIDFNSLYPHIMSMFNLFAETIPSVDKGTWHGNELFKVKGYYDVSNKHRLSEIVEDKLRERFELQKIDKNNPMVYTDKIFLNCFSEDTDVVMANNSIKHIKDCVIGEEIYSINPVSLKVEKKEIINVFKYDYEGDMHRYKGNYFDFLVTPNHRFLVEHKNNKKDIKFVESINIETKYKLPIHKINKKNYVKTLNILNYLDKSKLLYSFRPEIHARAWLYLNKIFNVKAYYNCNDRNFVFPYEFIKSKLYKILKEKDTQKFILHKELRRSYKIPIFYDNEALSYIIGIYLAEGSTCHIKPRQYDNGNVRGNSFLINISQYKDVNPIVYEKIIKALDKCGLKYSAGKKCIKISNKCFYEFILNNFGSLGNKCIKNKEMYDVLNLSSVFEALIDGDGTKASYRYTTKYDCLKEDFIELCMRLGYTFHIYNDGCWRIVYNNKPNAFRKANRKNLSYKGQVYCVEVKDNNTLLAGRNGKFNWSGNSLYGCIRSSLFEKVHSENAGWDTCCIGQQMQKLASDMMEEFGFETIAGDTDSLMIMSKDKSKSNEKYVKECLSKIVQKIDLNVPFAVGTFDIKIENHIQYIKFPMSYETVLDEQGNKIKEGKKLVKSLKAKKKNYLYLYEDNGKAEIELVGLPIKKDNATPLALKIYNEILKSKILEQKHANFTKEYIDNIINEWLKDTEIFNLLAVEYKIKPAHTYKKENQIQAQIGRNYLNGNEGIVFLIKNNKIGKVGKGQKYCKIEEAKEAKLKTEDLDLEKVYNELAPFILRD